MAGAITWPDPGYANTLRFGWPLDNAVTDRVPREGSDWSQSAGGTEDAWIIGWDYVLQGDVRWIPRNNITVPVTATGWYGTTGWRGFLSYARDKGIFRYIPNFSSPGTYTAGCYLVEPMSTYPGLEEDGTFRVTLVIRNPTNNFEYDPLG